MPQLAGIGRLLERPIIYLQGIDPDPGTGGGYVPSLNFTIIANSMYVPLFC